ncbi:MAG TPA: hypothetical protein PLW65_04365 [Pseudomonadota bacterium]|nr:hypothetical protein [Pseudomonadota bacterium]
MVKHYLRRQPVEVVSPGGRRTILALGFGSDFFCAVLLGELLAFRLAFCLAFLLGEHHAAC